MEEVKLNITTDGKELVIRTGEALPVHDKEPVSLQGTIDSVLDFATKRKETFDKNKAHVVISRKHGTRYADSVIKKQIGDSKAIELKAEADANAVKVKASADSEAITKVGGAEADIIQKKGEATAQAYKKQTEAMGQDNFTAMQIMGEISKGNFDIVPKIVSGGGSGDSVNSLVGIELLKQLGAFPKKFEVATKIDDLKSKKSDQV